MLRIHPTGNIGNQMMQYMVVSDILRRVPDVELCGYDMPMWRMSAPCRSGANVSSQVLGGRYIPVRQIAGYLRRGLLDDLTVRALSLRLGQLGSPDRHRHRFRPPDELDVEVFGDEFVVVNIRGGEILADMHPDYGPIPMSFVDQVVAATSKQPVFVGQLGDDPYTEHIMRRYPDALFRPSRGALVDFETIRRADEVVVSVSTFSWLAAWLSRAARVHLPVSGFLDPRRRPDIDLLPTDDPRYLFYEFDARPWRATEADFARLWTPGERHRVLSPTTVRNRRRAARARFAANSSSGVCHSGGRVPT